MSKRPANDDLENGVSLKSGERPVNSMDHDEAGDFEDEFEDEFDSEDEVIDAEAEAEAQEDADGDQQMTDAAPKSQSETFIPGRNEVGKNEVLSADPTAYRMLHNMESPWPCLSFDILPDYLGDDRKVYPATLYAVAGTQAAHGREKENQITVMKLSSLSRMDQNDQEVSDDEEEDDEENDEPVLESRSIPMKTCTNRIRAHQCSPWSSTKPPDTFTAAMSESGEVFIHNITPHLTAFDTPGFTVTPRHNEPISVLRCHGRSEGYAVDWSPLFPEGKLATGDCDGRIFVTSRQDNGSFVSENKPYVGHSGSVEEIQWSPTEKTVFASASSDGTVKIWDTRSKTRKSALSVQVSSFDVNVLSWSHLTPHLLASGADDGSWAVWDLRKWKAGAGADVVRSSSVASYTFHKEQITSVEWHPTDNSIVAVAAGDNSVTLWDLSVEFDDEESRETAGVPDVPPQLLFHHYMPEVKELHWHPQIPGCVMATGGSGFGIFQTISV